MFEETRGEFSVYVDPMLTEVSWGFVVLGYKGDDLIHRQTYQNPIEARAEAEHWLSDKTKGEKV